MPAPKTVPLSVRVSSDDAEFIARLDVAGATTPSDKIRALLADARRRQESFRDFPGALAMLQEMLAPTLQGIREAENRERLHSEPISQLGEWLPETLAFLLSGLDGPDAGDRKGLSELERGLVDRVFRLLEGVLRLGVTRTCRAYEPGVIDERLGPILEIAELIRNRR